MKIMLFFDVRDILLFNGLHYMICKIKAEGNITKNKYFSLYVNDNDLSKSYLKS